MVSKNYCSLVEIEFLDKAWSVHQIFFMALLDPVEPGSWQLCPCLGLSAIASYKLGQPQSIIFIGMFMLPYHEGTTFINYTIQLMISLCGSLLYSLSLLHLSYLLYFYRKDTILSQCIIWQCPAHRFSCWNWMIRSLSLSPFSLHSLSFIIVPHRLKSSWKFLINNMNTITYRWLGMPLYSRSKDWDLTIIQNSELCQFLLVERGMNTIPPQVHVIPQDHYMHYPNSG